MKNHLFVLVFGAVVNLFVLTMSSAQAQVIDVYLLGGQSNMDGLDEGSPYAAALPANLQAPQANVQFYYNDYLYYTGHVGLGPLEPVTGSTSDSTETYFGPEITFGYDMAQYQNPAGVQVAIIKSAVSGSSLYGNWYGGTSATESAYTQFKTDVSNGLAQLAAANPGATIVISGMLWMQGEADADNQAGANAYETNLTNFIQNIRLNYGANLPFVIGELANSQTSAGPYLSTVQAAQVAVADGQTGLTDIGLVNTNNDPNNGLHFTPVGQEDLGNQFAASMETFVAAPEPSPVLLFGIGALLLGLGSIGCGIKRSCG